MMKTVPESELPTVKLLGEDGNAFSILGKVRRELRRSGYSREDIGQFTKEATSGTYDHLRRWCMNRNWPATNPTHRSITYQERTTMAYRARPSG